jgi:hypothetical protein
VSPVELRPSFFSGDAHEGGESGKIAAKRL